jgi:hypothetical protein
VWLFWLNHVSCGSLASRITNEFRLLQHNRTYGWACYHPIRCSKPRSLVISNRPLSPAGKGRQDFLDKVSDRYRQGDSYKDKRALVQTSWTRQETHTKFWSKTCHGRRSFRSQFRRLELDGNCLTQVNYGCMNGLKYPDWGCSWFSSFPLAECRGSVFGTPASYSVGLAFRSRPGDRLPYRGGFLSRSRKMLGKYLKLGHDRLLPFPLQWIMHYSSYHSTLYNLCYWEHR